MKDSSRSNLGLIVGTVVASLLAGGAALVIFNRSENEQDAAEVANHEAPMVAGDSVAVTPSRPASERLDLHPSLKERRYDATIRDIVIREDPVIDGWDTERFSELADAQFKIVGKFLAEPQLIDGEHIRQLCVERFQGVLKPSKLQPAYGDASFHVERSTSHGDVGEIVSDGYDAFTSAMKSQASVFASMDALRSKFKTIRVELDDTTAKTTSYFQMSGRRENATEGFGVQVNSTWDCVWELSVDGTPRFRSISVSDYEEVSAKQDRQFVDCTQSAFEDTDVLGDQLVYGRDHWYGNLESSIGVEGRGNGIAIGDANGDGLDDIYLCQPAALPNLLLIRQQDGSLKNVEAEANVDWLDSSRGALFVDLDNDGDQDLVVTQSSHVLVHENNGSGNFQLRIALPTNSRLFSVNAMDYDLDSDLDLFVCGYSGAGQIRPEDVFASPVPYHDANNGAPNVLLRNDGNWSFRDVTQETGLDQNNLRFSLASTWDDFDNDGDLDLYVANDFGRNNLYRNDGLRFVDVATEAGVEDVGPGMSVATGDYNNDGLADIYVSNMFSSAGSRITHNAKFKAGANAEDLRGFQRHARGNSLFANNGDGTFSDNAQTSGTLMGRWAWGSLLVDINNDGWQDAYVTNGFVTADNNNDL